MTFLLYGHARAEGLRSRALEEASYTSDAEHEALLRAVAEERIRIAFALDGWSVLADQWEKAKASRDDRACMDVIGLIQQDMPKPPAEVDAELKRARGEKPTAVMRGRQIREFHSWTTNEFDQELYDRVMAARETPTLPASVWV
jgi:hypothetical protein